MKKALLLMVFGWSSFVATSQDTNCACCSKAHQAFDFWVGSWEVTNANGTAAGKNVIEKQQGGCILVENWTSATVGYTGTSTNYYNPNTGLWEQLWIDNSGAILKLKGKRIGNQMILSSDEFEASDGKMKKNRITWTLNNDGSVRQLWEILIGDEVANIAFDGLYKKTE